MSLSHKAFAFDWQRFNAGLAPILLSALSENDTTHLVAFIHRERGYLTDPYEGEPLSADWHSTLQKGDVQKLGDFALTRYYNVLADSGVGDQWVALEATLPKPQALALLGTPVCDGERCFDPGYQGSYFQAPAVVRQSISILRGNSATELASYFSLLTHCAAKDLGLYVTF